MADKQIKSKKKHGVPFVKGDKRCGRPKGLQNKATRDIKEIHAMVLKAMQEGKGIEAIVKGASKNAKLSYISKALPQKLESPDKSQDAIDAGRYRIRRGLIPHQITLMDSLKRRKLGMAGRRAGKTYYIGRRFADVAITHSTGEMMYIGLTAKNAWEQMYPHVSQAFDNAGIEYTVNGTKNQLEYGVGGVLRFIGNDSKDEREKMRGYGKDRRLVIIDECQSQKELKYLVTEILEPTLFDTGAPIEMFFTPPRVRGTWIEDEWNNPNLDCCRVTWNMFDNPNIPDAQKQLDTLLIERGWNVNDPLVQREYFGRIVYDDDAMVLHFTDKNYYTQEQFKEWLSLQAKSSLRCVCGLDLGYEDADAVIAFVYSVNDDKMFAVHQETIRRQLISDTVAMCKRALTVCEQYTKTQPYIMTDMGGLGKKIGEELFYNYKLPILAAEKSAKEMSVESLQEDVDKGVVIIPKGSLLDKDALRVIFQRDEKDNVIRVLDDTFHSDIFDAALYATREGRKHIKRG